MCSRSNAKPHLTRSIDEKDIKSSLLRAQELGETATHRWLTKDEICFLLEHSNAGYLPTYQNVQIRPTSGSLFFYNSTQVPDHKKDCWTWQQRKDNSGRVREDRAKLVVNRSIVILGTYVHSAEIPTFHRRSYYFRDMNPHILLVHYFDEIHKGTYQTNGIKRSSNQTSSVSPPLSPSLTEKIEQENIMNECFAMDYYLPSMITTEMEPTSTPSLVDESFPGLNTLITSTKTEDQLELIEISDYTPDWDFIVGGAKILICLASPLVLQWCQDSKRLVVRFTSSTERFCVKAERISDTVIRCAAPQAAMPGLMELELCVYTVDSCMPLSTKRRFTYKEHLTIHTKGSRPAIGKRERSPLHSMTSQCLPSSTVEGPRRPSFSRRGSNPDGAPLSAFVDTALDERQCKIRVVERLTEFQDAIRTTSYHTKPSSPIHLQTCTIPSTCCDQSGLLSLALNDGNTIEKLTDQELESLSETLLERVVLQLISVAHESEELLDELNSLDETGLSLLHYVSFYNYAHLIPVLLSHGAHVNQQSTQGYTPLHLAAGCGHQNVVQALVVANADLFLMDFDGFTPAERAEKSGNGHVAMYLKRLMSQSMDANDLFESLAMEIDQEQGTPQVWTSEDSNLVHDMNFDIEYTTQGEKPTYVDENQEHNRKLLMGAFSTMSLHDKCALSLSMSSRRRSSSFADDIGELIPTIHSNGSSPSKIEIGSNTMTSLSSGENESICDSDVKSVIAEDEASFYKLEAAMELMGPEELQSLEEEARVIQHNVRAWLLRRNCRNMREATKRLHEAAKSMEVSEQELLSQQLLSERERAAVTVQAAARTMLARKSFLQTRNVAIRVQAATRGVICRKNFARMKTHALASLVIQRNVREWLSKQPGSKQINGTNEPVSSSILVPKHPSEQVNNEMNEELTRMLMDASAA